MRINLEATIGTILDHQQPSCAFPSALDGVAQISATGHDFPPPPHARTSQSIHSALLYFVHPTCCFSSLLPVTYYDSSNSNKPPILYTTPYVCISNFSASGLLVDIPALAKRKLKDSSRFIVNVTLTNIIALLFKACCKTRKKLNLPSYSIPARYTFIGLHRIICMFS
jgi:hypothetical protein